jgi:regulator of sigma E protease
VQGEEVGTFDEVRRIIEKLPGQVISFKVFRDNRYEDVDVVANEIVGSSPSDTALRPNEDDELWFGRRGSVGIESSAPAAVIGVADAESPAYRAGLRTFDVVTRVAGVPVHKFHDLEVELDANHGETIPVTYLRPTPLPALGGLATMAVYEAGVVALTPESTGTTVTERTGIELADLYVSELPDDSPLHSAGLRVGDRLLKLDDGDLPAWSTFIERVWRERDREHDLQWRSARDGRLRAGRFQMRREDFTDEHGQTFARYRFRVQHWVPLSPDDLVEHPAPIRYALTKAVEETVSVTRFIVTTLGKMLQGRVSLDSLSGPITIYEVAGEEGRKGTDNFIWVMALVSINLGLLNLLPIPVLDGGHLLFFGIEAVVRRSIPLRVREVAHVFGLLVIVTLGAIAFKNDLERRWDAIRSEVSELAS